MADRKRKASASTAPSSKKAKGIPPAAATTNTADVNSSKAIPGNPAKTSVAEKPAPASAPKGRKRAADYFSGEEDEGNAPRKESQKSVPQNDTVKDKKTAKAVKKSKKSKVDDSAGKDEKKEKMNFKTAVFTTPVKPVTFDKDEEEESDGGWDALHSKSKSKASKAKAQTKAAKNGVPANADKKKKPTAAAAEPVVLAQPAKHSIKKKAVIQPPSPRSDDEISLGAASDGDSDSESDDEDQTTALLKGFESSDEEDERTEGAEDTDGALASLKSRSFKDLKVPDIQKKIEARKGGKSGTNPGYIYLSRIPHGFYEPEMRAYFSQFGTLLRLRLSRNKKTGRSKHYAFLEFAEKEVAVVVAETMDNYLLFGHILKCKVLERDNLPGGGDPEKLFKGAGKRYKKIRADIRQRRLLERRRTGAEWGSALEKEMKKREKKQAKLKELGIEYDFADVTEKAQDMQDVEMDVDGGVKLVEEKVGELTVAEEEKVEKMDKVEKVDKVDTALPPPKDPKKAKKAAGKKASADKKQKATTTSEAPSTRSTRSKTSKLADKEKAKPKSKEKKEKEKRKLRE